jgi:hypothetical protein
MTDSLLRALRETALDESEPLAGLLRKCLLLGAETGSDSLRQWARNELNGYEEGVDVPPYRSLLTPPISVDSISGNTHVRGQKFHRIELPQKAQKGVPEHFLLQQPVEELERLATLGDVSFTSAGLAYAQMVWNQELERPFQRIIGMSFIISGSAIAGVLGQIRTQLVDVIADLTASTPLTELPRKDQVDAAVSQHIDTQYNTTIHASNGPTAIGTEARASTKGISLKEAIQLLDGVRAAAEQVPGTDSAELLHAVEELRATAEQEAPETGEVVTKVGKLRAAADKIGLPMLTAAVGGVVETFTSLAVGGAFG